MPDPAPSSSRLEDLRMRWQLDPSSRVYLQLAEEYRKLDRHPEAIEVLKRGLQQRPNDLSGQVALGRCHLEMDELEPALSLLEAVIDRDPAHMVGNKLLLEAYLKSGEAPRAGERLELYKLLNPADPDIEALETQLRNLRSAAPGIPAPEGVTTAEIPIVPRGEEALASPELEEVPAEEVFEISPEPAWTTEPVDEEPPASPARDPAFETSPAFVLPDLIGAGADESRAEAAAPAAEEPPLIDEALIGDSAPAETTLDEIPLSGTPPEEEPAFELVPGEPAAEVAAAELPADDEIFHLGPPPPPPRFEELWGWPVTPPLMASPPVAEPPLEEPVLEEPLFEELEEPQLEEPQLEEPQLEEPAAEVEEVVATPEPVAMPAAPRVEEPRVEEPATATLGALYLRQGHAREAEKIFRQVLRRDPRNAAALAGLARIRGETGLTAQALLASAGERIPVGLTAKKIRLLESYMNHLRNTGESHVH